MWASFRVWYTNGVIIIKILVSVRVQIFGFVGTPLPTFRGRPSGVETGACRLIDTATVYPKKYAHGFVVLCFVVVMQSFIMNSHEVFIHIRQGCFACTGAIVRLPQCQWSKPGGYGKISQCITTTKHSKAKTVCIFLGIYCMYNLFAVAAVHIVVSRCWNYQFWSEVF